MKLVYEKLVYEKLVYDKLVNSESQIPKDCEGPSNSVWNKVPLELQGDNKLSSFILKDDQVAHLHSIIDCFGNFNPIKTVCTTHTPNIYCQSSREYTQ